MVGPRRPQFVLFGSSIVEKSFGQEGWGATLADIYARKADIFVRGYGGWNSRQALEVLDQVFSKDDVVQPSLAIVYFGGNDSTLPAPDGSSGPHVPLSEYVENMRKIAIHLESLPEMTRLIFLTAPPVNEAQATQTYGPSGRTNVAGRKYADALVELCQETGINSINLYDAFEQQDDWLTTAFTDGIHLSPGGSKIMAKEILKVLEEADWKPSLYWEDLPSEFA